jgi:uncharacterized protein YwqG
LALSARVMGLFDLFRKKPSAPVEQEQSAELVMRLEATRVPYAAISVGEPTDDVRASKLGGVPYRPTRGRYDALLSAGTTVFIAQIRCDELPAELCDVCGFPREGLLQFWLGKRDLVDGVGERSDGSVCLYYARFDEPQLAGWTPSFDREHSSLEDPEVGKRMRFTAETETMPQNAYDAAGHRVGGYCAFTQVDPRSPDDPMVSLLQLDSDAGVVWGDAGIAHWFLREDDLRAYAFGKTLFYWDCC